jgi:Chromosome segregation ATPases
MADKTMLNFRCPAELLEAIDTLGQERHPSETTKHGCDRTKTLLDIVRVGIEALSQGLAVLPVSDNYVRHSKTNDLSDIESRFAAIEQRLGKIEGLSNSPELPKPDVEVAESELQTTMGNLQAENEILRADYAKLLESSTQITNKLRQEVQELRSQLETERADREEVEAELAELAQIKKEAKEAAAELHAEGRAIEVERIRWQGELSDAKGELADAKVTILNQGNKIRELERGYSLKPNPKESALRLEIGELRSQLETERADRSEIEAELSELKKNFAPTATLSEKLTPDAATILSQLRARRKKSKTDLADLEAILEILES